MADAVAKIVAAARAARDSQGRASILAKDVAVLVRAKLKREFPGVKFSVRSEHNSVDVYWTDGPVRAAVDSAIAEYSFGGFDGMIDLAYEGYNWLLPDGSMQGAWSPGTTGSMGCHEGFASDCPVPGAVLVKYGPRYVFAHRRESEELFAALVARVEERFGEKFRRDLPLWNQRVEALGGEYLTTVCLRLEAGHYDS